MFRIIKCTGRAIALRRVGFSRRYAKNRKACIMQRGNPVFRKTVVTIRNSNYRCGFSVFIHRRVIEAGNIELQAAIDFGNGFSRVNQTLPQSAYRIRLRWYVDFLHIINRSGFCVWRHSDNHDCTKRQYRNGNRSVMKLKNRLHGHGFGPFVQEA